MVKEQIKCIERLERIDSSVNGAAFLISFTDGSVARTQSDASCEIGNPGLREGSTVAVRYSRRGSITAMSKVTRVE
jgi:hypothetical protein